MVVGKLVSYSGGCPELSFLNTLKHKGFRQQGKCFISGKKQNGTLKQISNLRQLLASEAYLDRMSTSLDYRLL